MFKIKRIKNFAVIQDLKNTLELKDLTIFMGDNSAGKSYMAMLIHSFIKSNHNDGIVLKVNIELEEIVVYLFELNPLNNLDTHQWSLRV